MGEALHIVSALAAYVGYYLFSGLWIDVNSGLESVLSKVQVADLTIRIEVTPQQQNTLLMMAKVV